jgi:hypothetical protein
LSISNRQSKIGNSSHPGQSNDRRNSSQEMKKFGTIESCIINAMVPFLKTPIMPVFEQRFIAL